MNPPTAKSYEGAMKGHKLTPLTEDLPNGTKANWIGKKDAKNVLVYYHGGGFVLPIHPAYFEFLIPTVQELNAAGKDFAIVVLSYTLAPIAQYPTQLEQCVELLRYILNETGRSPSSVLIGGDSAGGNLTLGVLSHLSHPHPAIKPLELSEPLMGALLISPWVSFDTSLPAVKENEYKDCVSPRVTPVWSGAMLGKSPTDNYNEAVNAPVDWWKGLKAKDILIVGGTDEILIDSIRDISKKIEVRT
jgi:acetyl esterase/lipase